MKIQVKSNFNNFIKRFRDIPRIIDVASYDAIKELLERMCEDMKEEIRSQRDTWAEVGGPFENWGDLGNDIEYEVNEKSGRIYVGRNTHTLKVGKGDNRREVNPYMFIEFGWGIQGEQNPVRYHTQHGWEYNINKHREAWSFYGVNGNLITTTGRRGIDFFYNTINKYRKEWKDIVSNIIDKKFRAEGWDVR